MIRLPAYLVLFVALCGAILPVTATPASDLLLLHRWYTPAELAALNILRERVESRGDRWIPLAVNQPGARGKSADEMLDAGTDLNAFLDMHPATYRKLMERNLLISLEEQFTASGLLDQLPPLVRNAITVDGHIVKAPATLNIDATIYYNKAVAEAVGVDPASWTSLDAMWADFPAIRKAGYLPLAIAVQPWQISYLTHSLVATIAGASVFEAIYSAHPDPDVLSDPSLLDVFAWLRRFQQEADPLAMGRDWNAATGMVISGQALMQIHGDWMQREWHAAGKTLDIDYGCRLLPGARALPVSVETWGLIASPRPDGEAASRAFAQDATDRDVQIRFAHSMGSTPVRRDAWTMLDACSRLTVDALDRPGFAVETPMLKTPTAWLVTIQQIANQFWAEPDMSPAQAVALLQHRWAVSQ
jgi:glucose/mannose transport system substrate-binding protein